MEHVADAARRTLAQRGVRISYVYFVDPPAEKDFTWRWEGVADLAAGRSRLVELPEGPIERLVAAATRRWPWLEDDDPEEQEAIRSERVGADGRAFQGYGDQWWEVGRAISGRHPDDPTWILEELTRVVSAGSAGVLTAGRARAFVETGTEGLIRGVTWTELVRARRPPVHRPWHRLELWDFGIPVDIPTPAVTPEPEDEELPSLWEVAGTLYRMRRDWRRTHSR